MSDLRAAWALGWASIGIAFLEILAPKWLQAQLGIGDHRTLIRTMGARELASGVAILSQRQVTPTLAAALWSRVAGDALDLTLLASASGQTRRPTGLAAAAVMVAGITALDILYARRIQQHVNTTAHGSSGHRIGEAARAGSQIEQVQ